MFNWLGSAQTQETGVEEANKENISEIDYAKDVAKNVGSKALFYRMYPGF